ncbi:MAG: amidase [Planctomycetaceae bacterium]|jgi:aspartyl-tRNA(Asn)/glutamyl-tRNA(Gln) amidotransferase subunit A|nr:amidase [Planctomycetaceae bacterium]MDP7274540.1 amidase [Planctomycetaceae bacterium]
MALKDKHAFASVRTLGDRLRRREFTAVELTGFFLDRLETLGPKLNAVVTVTRETALAEAGRADAELAAGRDRGPLHGIPYGAKDLLATRGIPTSWGAAPWKDRVIDADATVIRRLRDGGAILAAKLAMVEIAGGLGYRQANASFTGPGLNPWDTRRWSGGSSSGPGSAVAGGLVPFAIGSETWGSIMTPAGFCGLSGLRPTYGRVSRHGAMALSWTMDKLGPMARTADDCGLVLAAIAGHDPADATSVDRPFQWCRDSIEKKRRFQVAILKGCDDHVQKPVKKNFRKSIDKLERFCNLSEVALPDLPYEDVAGTFIDCEMAAAFEGLVSSGDVWELTAPEDRHGGHAAMVIPAKDYINAMRIRPKIQRAVDRLFDGIDALVTPTLATVAYPIDRSFRDYRRGFHASRIGGAGNAAGIPAISVPNGFGEDDLPTGLQIVGPAWSESTVLEIATRYQDATDFHEKHPDD